MELRERVYPSKEELTDINPVNVCPECFTTFKSDSNLKFHMAKTHKQDKFLQPNDKIYHCPVIACTYHQKNYFKHLKFLKQHYLKVHSEKKYECNLCQRKFATEWFRNQHMEYCNVSFECCDCNASYALYETLKTHSRRKRHKILEKSKYKIYAIVQESDNNSLSSSATPMRVLLPKPVLSSGTIVLLKMNEQSSQTDCIQVIQKKSQETQTLNIKMSQASVQTQTIGDCFSVKGAPIENKNRITQTGLKSPKSVSCNTSFPLDDFDFIINEVHRSTSSTQTTSPTDFIYSSSTSTHDSIHTDTSDLFTDTLDSNYFNTNMETQTDFMFKDDLFRCCDYYSNMHTQTCQDPLLGEIEFNTSQTQTMFNYVLKSVESQTVMSQPMNCKDMAHMETQTDMEFTQMLEEINA